MIIFETDRLRVRHFTISDADNYFSLQSNPDVMQYIRPPRTRDESDTFLKEKILTTAADDFKGIWLVEEKETGLFLGCFVIIPLPNDTVNIQLGYSFLPQYWGKGYATEVATAGVNYFRNKTPLNEIYGVTEVPNVASQKVLLKAGFIFHASKMEEGKELLVFVLRK